MQKFVYEVVAGEVFTCDVGLATGTFCKLNGYSANKDNVINLSTLMVGSIAPNTQCTVIGTLSIKRY